MSVYSILEHLKEPKIVSIAIPILEQEDPWVFQGIAVANKSPSFQVFFQKDYLPSVEEIDKESRCRVTLNIGGPSLSVFALIDTVDYKKDRDVIQLTALDMVEHSQKREYIRAPAEYVHIKYTLADDQEGDFKRAYGVNISCGGILIVSEKVLGKRQKLQFEIKLPYPEKVTIYCCGKILRVIEKRDGSCLTAIQFEDVAEEDCDAIMAYCFAEQRRQLRENVRVSDI